MNAVIEPEPTSESLGNLLQRQRDAFLAELPVSRKDRIDRLDRAIALLVEHSDALTQAMHADYGHRPQVMSKFTDVAASIGHLKHARRHVRRWMRKDRRSVRFPLGLLGAGAWVQYQPKGVVGIIAPWNFPVYLAFGPLAGALAAGNRCMIKPSEFTPRTSELLAETIGDAFSEEEVAVVLGGADVGKAFSALPFDHLIFTGSTSIGRHIMRAAADNLTPVTLELGGKSPTIVTQHADLQRAAERILLGKLMNAGQVCLAPDYLLVQDKVADRLVDAIRESAAHMYPEALGGRDLTNIIDNRQLERLENLRAEAQEANATIEELPLGNAYGGDRQMPLTVIRNPDTQLGVMQEEIFGPILPVITYAKMDDAIRFINNRPRPLGLYLFSEDRTEQQAVLDRIVAGGVTLNDSVFHISVDDLPFGGVGDSGMGHYHGFEGFKTFSHAKAVYRQTGLPISKLMGLMPPYGDKLKKLLDWEVKR